MKGGVILENKKMTLKELMYKQSSETLSKKFPTKQGRQRPRNPQEKAYLNMWENERGGKKIGTI